MFDKYCTVFKCMVRKIHLSCALDRFRIKTGKEKK